MAERDLLATVIGDARPSNKDFSRDIGISHPISPDAFADLADATLRDLFKLAVKSLALKAATIDWDVEVNRPAVRARLLKDERHADQV